MANSLTFTTPAGENVTFTLTAATAGQDPAFMATFTTTGDITIYLKVFETGDSENPITNYSTMEQGKLYDIEAYSDAGFTTPTDITSWSGTNVEFVSYTFAADSRPLWVAGYATQTTSSDPRVDNSAGGQFIAGVTNNSGKPYRKTPVAGAADAVFEDAATNGRISWIDDNVKPAVDEGFERLQFINCNGHTNLNGTQTDAFRTADSMSTTVIAMQPHYPTMVYGGMDLTTHKYFYDDLDSAKVISAPTPFTDTGQPSGTPGDAKTAWAKALEYIRAQTVNDLEITSYQGYRVPFTDDSMTTLLTDVTSLSSQSNSNLATPQKKAVWSGSGTSPGFCPEPGFDANASGSKSPVDWVEKAKMFWDAEIAGLYELGFDDGIGLDTGTRVWDNAAGRSNGSNHYLDSDFGTPNAPDGTVSSDLVDFFNGFGIKPMFEAVGLDTWTVGAGINAAPANDGRYANSAHWAFFGSWWGYEGTVTGLDGNDITIDSTMFGQTSSGGRVSQIAGDTYVGAGANKRKFDRATEEVHVIVQWNGTQLNNLINGTGAGMAQGIGLLGVKQILWDMHNAGLVVSASGSATATPGGIDSADFRAYVLDLYNNPNQERPTSQEDWDTYAIAETSSIVSNGSTWVTGVTMTPTGQLFDISQLRITSAVQVRDLSGTVTAAYETDVPYIAVWNATTGVWTTHAWQTDSGQIQQYTLGGTVPTVGDTLVVVGLSQDPGDISGWSDYN